MREGTALLKSIGHWMLSVNLPFNLKVFPDICVQQVTPQTSQESHIVVFQL
jgi:hypothetical protein